MGIITQIKLALDRLRGLAKFWAFFHPHWWYVSKNWDLGFSSHIDRIYTERVVEKFSVKSVRFHGHTKRCRLSKVSFQVQQQNKIFDVTKDTRNEFWGLQGLEVGDAKLRYSQASRLRTWWCQTKVLTNKLQILEFVGYKLINPQALMYEGFSDRPKTLAFSIPVKVS